MVVVDNLARQILGQATGVRETAGKQSAEIAM